MTQHEGPPAGGTANGVVYGVLAATIWGAWPVVSKLGVQQALSAWEVAALRFGVAGLALLPVAWRGLEGVGWRTAGVLALGAGAPYTLLAVGGLSFAPASHAGVILPSCTMLFSFLGSWLFLGDRPTPARAAGVAVISAGVVLMGWSGLAAGAGPAVLVGDLMFAGGGLLFATYTVVARHRRVAPLQAAAAVSVVSLLLYAVPFLLFHAPRWSGAPTGRLLVQAIFQGLLAAVLALVLHTRAVAILGVARGALFPALVPGVAALLAYPALGEAPNAAQLAGLAIVSLGLLATGR